MGELDQRIYRVVKNLSIQLLRFPSQHTSMVYCTLTQLLDNLKFLERQRRAEPQHLQITYDMLIIETSKIEQALKRCDWTVDQLLLLLDELASVPLMPDLIKNNHLIRRGMVKHHGLSLMERIELAKHAYARIRRLLAPDYVLSTERKFKLTLGNLFSGPNNLNILFNIHPHLTQLSLPLGPLKAEYELFLNRLITGMLASPKLNQEISVLTVKDRYRAHPNIDFNFKDILMLLNIMSDVNIFAATGERPEELDVKLVRIKISLLKQIRRIVLSGTPNRIQYAIQGQSLLQQTFIHIFTSMREFRPFYTWGSALDEAFNDLIDEVRGFSSEILLALTRMPAHISVAKPAWNIVGLWSGEGLALSSTLSMSANLLSAALPKIYTVYKYFFPDDSLNHLVVKSQAPLNLIFKHGLNLALQLEQAGLFHPSVQAALAPFREKFLALKWDPLQRMAAIYRSQFEQFIQDPFQAKMRWSQLQDESKREVLMNLAGFIHQLNIHLPTLLALISPRMLAELRHSTDHKSDVDGLILGIVKLQAVLKTEINPLMQTLLNILKTPGDDLTAGQAATSLVSSAGGIVRSAVGTIAGGVMDALTSTRLNLSFIPSEENVAHLPPSWQGKKLKAIFKDEFELCFKIIEHFNEQDFQQIYLVSSSRANLIDGII
jgi:hypothetical protein